MPEIFVEIAFGSAGGVVVEGGVVVDGGVVVASVVVDDVDVVVDTFFVAFDVFALAAFGALPLVVFAVFAVADFGAFAVVIFGAFAAVIFGAFGADTFGEPFGPAAKTIVAPAVVITASSVISRNVLIGKSSKELGLSNSMPRMS